MDSPVPQQVCFQGCLEFLICCAAQLMYLCSAHRVLQKVMQDVADMVSNISMTEILTDLEPSSLHADVLTIEFMNTFPFSNLECRKYIQKWNISIS